MEELAFLENGEKRFALACRYNFRTGYIVRVLGPLDGETTAEFKAFSYVVTYWRNANDPVYHLRVYAQANAPLLEELQEFFSGTIHEDYVEFDISSRSKFQHPLNFFRTI